jgi:UDP-N-acetyl-D-mannosaminuronic acid dehydrogenase
VSAELVKLFNNIARYVQFAVANQFALVADTFGANIYEIRRLANHKYPRSYLATPGFTAGTCLRKDFGMISEWTPYPDMLLAAWKVNEYIPTFMVKHMLMRTVLRDRKVAMLGYSFKADTDDTRDSLAPKLYRYIQRELPSEIRVTDYHLPDPMNDPINGDLPNLGEEAALANADCVFVATNHARYRDVLRTFGKKHPDAWIADIWNIGGIGQIFYQARALAEAK